MVVLRSFSKTAKSKHVLGCVCDGQSAELWCSESLNICTSHVESHNLRMLTYGPLDSSFAPLPTDLGVILKLIILEATCAKSRGVGSLERFFIWDDRTKTVLE